MSEGQKDRVVERRDRPRFQIRVPGFVGDEVIGLGDAIKHVTSTVGIRPCGGCSHRAEALNRLVGFRRLRHR